MLNRTEHLLTILAEECAEVAQRASKAIRFGLDEIQPGQSLTNRERLAGELADLLAVAQIINLPIEREKIEAKKKKVDQFMNYAIQCGTLEEE